MTLWTVTETAERLRIGKRTCEKLIQEALGHTSIALTAAVYAHVLPTLREDAGTKLEEALRR